MKVNVVHVITSLLVDSCIYYYCLKHLIQIMIMFTLYRNGELQISTNKNTRFDFQEFKNNYAKQDVVLSYKTIWSGSFLPLFDELDLIGIVILCTNKNTDSYDKIYISDKEMNIVCILFQSSIKVIYNTTKINYKFNKIFNNY